jgi:tetratricopeptide (TPR) repeat protein
MTQVFSKGTINLGVKAMVSSLGRAVFLIGSSLIVSLAGVALPVQANEPNPALMSASLGNKPTIRSLLPDDSLREFCRDVRINTIVIPSYCTLLVQARTQYQRGNYQSTVHLYNRLLSRHPNYGKGYYNRAMARLAMGQTDAARADLNKAVGLFQTQKDLPNQQLTVTALADLGS